MNFSIKKTGLFISALGFVALSNTALAGVQSEVLQANGEVTASTCDFSFQSLSSSVTSLTLDSISQARVLEATAGVGTAINQKPFSLDFQNCTNTLNIQISMSGSTVSGDGSAGVTLGVFDDSLSYVHLDGFKIQNGARGIDAQNTIHLTVQNCQIEQVDNGILNRRANGWEHDQYFYNNTIVGETAWPQSGIPGERGIDIRGNNNVIANNTISYFGDGISTDGPPYLKSYSLDI